MQKTWFRQPFLVNLTYQLGVIDNNTLSPAAAAAAADLLNIRLSVAHSELEVLCGSHA